MFIRIKQLAIPTGVLLQICTTNILASEVDSFTNRHLLTQDSSEIINEKTNQFIKDALLRANDSSTSCDKKRLYKKLRKYFHNHIQGELPDFINHDPSVYKISLETNQTIFRDFHWHQSWAIGVVGSFAESLAKLIKVGDVYLGSDKFEHMFGMGYQYFKKYHLKEKPIEKAMAYGHFSEKYHLGLVTTGIYSYADQMANFTGMRFWNHILNEDEDILGQNLGPYVQCINEAWVQVKDVDWKNYINHAFDEGLNCSKFRSNNLLEKVELQIANNNDQTGYSLNCPIHPNKLDNLKEIYQHLPYPLINTQGHSKY